MEYLIIIALFIFGLAITTNNAQPKRDVKLVVSRFTEDSSLKKAGAKIGDTLLSYDGQAVKSIIALKVRKENVETERVDVVLLRDEETLTLTVPSGQLGVYFKEVALEHSVDDDAVIIEGIGELSWGIAMGNSFLAAVHKIDEKYGDGVSYTDIVGLSGYGFRLHFFDVWCPSSPDATCGKDVGSRILKKLGYEFDWHFLKSDLMTKEKLEMARTQDELRQIIMETIDAGYPVIAIDLLEIPEWGIITGYQKEGQELFCRTYFDKTEGYEIAKKFPWVICAITGKSDVDLSPEYKNSLQLAKELYHTDRYEEYFSGITAVKEWIKALRDEEFLSALKKPRTGETLLANWWIYYSLMDARNTTKDYLLDNKDKFGVDEELIQQLADLYAEELEILKSGFADVPSPHISRTFSDWSPELKEKQAKILEKFLEKENEVNSILTKID